MFTTLVTPRFGRLCPSQNLCPSYRTTHPEDAPGILHYSSGSAAYGRLDLTDKSPLDPLYTPS
eukprot:1022090-Prorocentrum_minimum.AAC.2